MSHPIKSIRRSMAVIYSQCYYSFTFSTSGKVIAQVEEDGIGEYDVLEYILSGLSSNVEYEAGHSFNDLFNSTAIGQIAYNISGNPSQWHIHAHPVNNPDISIEEICDGIFYRTDQGVKLLWDETLQLIIPTIE